MTMPFYVSPEQLIKDRADFAQKGIGRGRSVIVLTCSEGILFATHNPSRALHKVSEIYDRIAFAAVGKFNEFEALRVAGIRYADLRGYSYDRSDVSARGLANAYAQTLGTAFTTESKPLEVELAVAEIGDEQKDDQIYRISFDGSVSEVHGVSVMGASAELLRGALDKSWSTAMNADDALRVAYRALHEAAVKSEAAAAIDLADLEVALLDRTRPQRRKFRRFSTVEITERVGESSA